MLSDDDKRWIEERLTMTIATFNTNLERMETKLLTAFQQWASPNEARQRRYAAELREFEATLEYHEDRIRKLEKGE
jgi:hypothetical protein